MASKSVLQECQVRVSSKKGVVQECHLSVSRQGVPQVGSLENVINKYCFCSSTCVSAFGFVGFILFFGDGPYMSVCFCSRVRRYKLNVLSFRTALGK